MGLAKTRNLIGIEFLRTEVETASVFAKIASDATDEEKKLRNRHNAIRAYETLVHFVNQFALTIDEEDEIRGKLMELRRKLVKPW